MKTFLPRTLLILFSASSAFTSAAPKVEEQDFGPADPEAKYVASRQGGHLAVVARKGSRVSVIVDGVAGPRIDEVVMGPGRPVDPRPLAEEARRANTLPGNIRPAVPVTFSRDGKRHAYVARISQEWVLIVDGKELLRLPVPQNPGNTELRLDFTPDGKRMLFARSTPNGIMELWVDGQKWPGGYSSTGSTIDDATDPMISPDGQHIAYVGLTNQNKEVLIFDGKEAGYFGTNLRFTPDSRHLVSVGKSPQAETLQVDGKPVGTAKRIVAVYVPTTGANRIVAVVPHENQGRSEGFVLLVDGKIVPVTLSQNANLKVIFSPDGKHYAAVCGKPGAQYVVIDGKKGQEYSVVDSEVPGAMMRFSPDSAKLAYVATAANKNFVVINEEESDTAFDSNAAFTFSDDGKRVAYNGSQASQGRNQAVFIDGKPERLGPLFELTNFKFSPDSSRYAYHTGSPRDGGPLFVDGKATDLNGTFLFSPDGKHLALVGDRATDSKRGLFMDGELIYDGQHLARYRAFTTDSQHLFWIVKEAATGAKAAPGVNEWVAYLDGEPVARFDGSPVADNIFADGFGTTPSLTRGWDVGQDGVITFLGPVGDTVKRFKVASSSGRGLAAKVNAAKAAMSQKK